MTTTRLCFTAIPSILKRGTTIARLAQPSVRLQHAFRTRNATFLTPAHNLCVSLQKRDFISRFIKDRNKDDVPEGRVRVYYGLLTSQVRAVKWFSLTTSVFGVLAQPFLYKELSTLNSTPLLVVGLSFVGMFTFVTPLLLHFITKKYVSYLDYNPEKGTYIAATVNFFSFFKEVEFTPEDVKVPDIPGMFTTMHVKGTPMFMEARMFDDPSHYAKIMGYDKPMDFKLYPPGDDAVKTKK